MTVKEFKHQLDGAPDDAQVILWQWYSTDEHCGEKISMLTPYTNQQRSEPMSDKNEILDVKNLVKHFRRDQIIIAICFPLSMIIGIAAILYALLN